MTPLCDEICLSKKKRFEFGWFQFGLSSATDLKSKKFLLMVPIWVEQRNKNTISNLQKYHTRNF